MAKGLKGFQKGHERFGGRRKGIPCSDDTKEKIRLGNIGKIGLSGENNPMFGKTPWNKGIPRDQETKKRISDTKKRTGIHAGENNNFWKGGIKKPRKHYKRVYCPNHPSCSNSGQVTEHRLVMEKHIGRYLTKYEVVHHINEDIHDNRIENLHLFKNKGEHSAYHGRKIFSSSHR